METGGLPCQYEELTRPQVAAMMKPQVSARQLYAYLNIARKYLPEFEKFNNRRTGGINGYAKLYECHVPALQEIRTLAREHTLEEIEDEFKKRALEKQKTPQKTEQLIRE